ncbi:MAG: fasciclin domain-containing protein [Ferruginibacter sp.]
MIHLIKKFKIAGLLALSALVFYTSSCNKDLEQFTEPVISNAGTLTLTEAIAADPDNSLYNALLAKSGMAPLFSDKASLFTMFVPVNSGMKLFINVISGGLVDINSPDAVFTGFISANIPAATAAALISYNTIPQKVTSGQVPTIFPNYEYPTILNPTGTSTTAGFNPFARLTTFPSRRGTTLWVDNIPVTAIDIPVVNGVIHKIAVLVAPPTKYLWDDIAASTDLTYLKAAIIRADSGVAVAGRIQTALSSFGANLTVLAPTDLAFKQTLTGAITQALIPVVTAQLIAFGLTPAAAAAQAPAVAFAQASALASSPGVFTNPALFSALTAQTVRGIVVYHVLSAQTAPFFPPGVRIFSVNIPATPTTVKTLLNSSPLAALHPGLSVQATGTGITVKGAANATPSNIIFPADRNALNGVLHKVDQVLLPL